MVFTRATKVCSMRRRARASISSRCGLLEVKGEVAAVLKRSLKWDFMGLSFYSLSSIKIHFLIELVKCYFYIRKY